MGEAEGAGDSHRGSVRRQRLVSRYQADPKPIRGDSADHRASVSLAAIVGMGDDADVQKGCGEPLAHTRRDEVIPDERAENYLLCPADANFLPLLLVASLFQPSQRWIVRIVQLAHVRPRNWPEVVGPEVALPCWADDSRDGVAKESLQPRNIEARSCG